MVYSKFSAFAALLLAGLFASTTSAISPTYQNFLDNMGTATPPILPDFSYAGYHYSQDPLPVAAHTVFNVTTYGAVADDGISDNTAIQAAIDAAEANGSGIVFFPPGRFHLNTNSNLGTTLTVNGDNIVFRGSGMNTGGTELFMQKNYDATDPDDLNSVPYILSTNPTSTSEGSLTTITADAQRSSFSVTVASTSNLSVNMWVTLSLNSTAAVNDFLGAYAPPDPAWTDLVNDGIVVRERHQIQSIVGNVVTFKEPIQVNVDTAYPWLLKRYPHLTGIGFEDLTFLGNWHGTFDHHASALDDGGWSCLDLNRCVESWIQRCRFKDWNINIAMDSCSAFTIIHSILEGNPGHISIQTRRGYGVLVGLCNDTQEQWHGPGTGYQNAAAVFWRYHFSSQASFDAHSGLPYATLIDLSEGGLKNGRTGGPLDGMPNHMGKFTLWNYNHTGSAISNYDFWRSDPNQRDRFLNPIIVGFHGSASTFKASHLEVYESQGTAVTPASLFEAQLARRLGSLPSWIPQAEIDWVNIQNGNASVGGDWRLIGADE